ncbi:LysR substrate-binding domain-containing protein [Microbulbifer sp. ZKSA006]|uniref:LysR substrate-binding domain-containing protein n=1 Tax=Microbulbifer sp. ZKSA006 TaxID=3243390 RepID=UPI00403973A4
MDRFRALEVFIAVADAGSFAAAARALSISAPSVTRIIGDLEAELGVTLFNRTTRLVSLTAVGKLYLEDTRRILHEYKAANDAVRGAHRVPTGQLRITAPTLFGQIYITPIIARYLNLYENTTVDAAYLDRVVNLFEEGIDLAIRIGHLPDSSLVATKIGSVQQIVCGTPSYLAKYGVPTTPKDLNNHTLIALKPDGLRTAWHFANDNLRIKPRLEFSSVQAAIDAAKMGVGLTHVLSYQIAPDLEQGNLQAVLSEFAPEPLPIHIVFGGSGRVPGKVRAFADIAIQELRGNPFLNSA